MIKRLRVEKKNPLSNVEVSKKGKAIKGSERKNILCMYRYTCIS